MSQALAGYRMSSKRCTNACTCVLQREVQYITIMHGASVDWVIELDEIGSLTGWMSMLGMGLKPHWLQSNRE